MIKTTEEENSNAMAENREKVFLQKGGEVKDRGEGFSGSLQEAQRSDKYLPT